MKTTARWLLTLFLIAAGCNHFLQPDLHIAMIPAMLPAPRTLVLVSGIAQVVGGLGLVFRSTRRVAAWGVVVLLIVLLPANVNMALHHLPYGNHQVPAWILWARVPLQAVFVAWAWWFTRPDDTPPG